MHVKATKAAGNMLKRAPTEGAVNITFEMCLYLRAGGLLFFVESITNNQTISTKRIRAKATKLNKRM